jgi:hypothetical protein
MSSALRLSVIEMFTFFVPLFLFPALVPYLPVLLLMLLLKLLLLPPPASAPELLLS